MWRAQQRKARAQGRSGERGRKTAASARSARVLFFGGREGKTAKLFFLALFLFGEGSGGVVGRFAHALCLKLRQE